MRHILATCEPLFSGHSPSEAKVALNRREISGFGALYYHHYEDTRLGAMGMAISTDSVFEHDLIEALFFLGRSMTGYKVSVGHFCMREALRWKRVADLMHLVSDSSFV